jgi:hypothetical protein
MAVNVVQSALSSRNFNRWLLWIGAAVLVAGVVAVLITYVGNTAKHEQVNPTGPAVKFTPTPKQIKFPEAAWKVAKEFAFTAVARKNLARSYGISDAQLRGGLTLKEWKTGTLPVIFYPTERIVRYNWKNTNYAYPREAQINVILLAKPSTGQKPLPAQIVLVKRGNGAGARWVVDHFQPLGGPPVPAP